MLGLALAYHANCQLDTASILFRGEICNSIKTTCFFGRSVQWMVRLRLFSTGICFITGLKVNKVRWLIISWSSCEKSARQACKFPLKFYRKRIEHKIATTLQWFLVFLTKHQLIWSMLIVVDIDPVKLQTSDGRRKRQHSTVWIIKFDRVRGGVNILSGFFRHKKRNVFSRNDVQTILSKYILLYYLDLQELAA